MADSYKLLTRVFAGVLKNQAKRLLGDEVISVLVEAGSEHLGEELLSLLKGEESARERAKKLEIVLRSAADELSQVHGFSLRLDIASKDVVAKLIDSLAKLETDLSGFRLQHAIQDLVADSSKGATAEDRRRMSIQLYHAVLKVALTIPELQPRAQDLLHESRTWLLGREQTRRNELRAHGRQEVSRPQVPIDSHQPGGIAVYYQPP